MEADLVSLGFRNDTHLLPHKVLLGCLDISTHNGSETFQLVDLCQDLDVWKILQ